MEVLHTEIQSLQKILYEVHEVRTKHRNKIDCAVCSIKHIKIIFFSYSNVQLVGEGGDSSGSESVLTSPPGWSPLRNTTLMAVQSALSKHQEQIQVRKNWQVFPMLSLFHKQ